MSSKGGLKSGCVVLRSQSYLSKEAQKKGAVELLGHFAVRLYAAFDDHGHRPASQFSRPTHKVFFSPIVDPLRLGHVPVKSGITFILAKPVTRSPGHLM